VKITFASLLIAFAVIFTGCGDSTISVGGKSAKDEQARTEENQRRLNKAQPAPKMDHSLERENLIKRVERFNNPQKISYIYLINYGKVMSFYAIKGKVSSVNSQLTNPKQAMVVKARGRGHVVTIDSPAEDGSYGTNGNAIFFFTQDDVYVEWAGDYMLCDQPLKLSTPPAMTYVKSIK
jgi:hypothetical protein